MYKSSLLIFLLLVVASASMAQSAMQTDWSGGAGVSGPVTLWENTFDMQSGVDWFSSTGDLKLAYTPPMAHIVSSSYTRGSQAVPVDLDGDNDLDLLTAAGRYGPPYFFSGRIDWYENVDGFGMEWVRHDVDDNFVSAPSVCSADIDGDGDMDIIGAAYGYVNDIAWWENLDGSATSWTQHVIPTTAENISSIDTADMNGDGFIDLVLTDSYNEVLWMENDGGTAPSWIENSIGYMDTPYDVFPADIDGDGDYDAVATAFNGDDISWFENLDGGGTNWGKHDIANDFNGARNVCAADIDGDNDMDVIGTASLAWEITWWENADGMGGSWTEHTISNQLNYAYGVYASDVNGDGDMDVLGAGFYSDAIVWWENMDGLGTDWNEQVIASNFDGARDVTVGDMDYDGDIDIVGVASEAGEIDWWDVTCCIGTGELVSSILDTEMEVEWDSLSWVSTEPEETSLYFQVRSSTDPLYMGEWSENIIEPAYLGDYLMTGDRYVQYKVFLEAEDAGISPMLEEVSVSWSDYVGVEQLDSWTVGQLAVAVYPNPTSGIVNCQLSTVDFQRVIIKLYDLYGRKVATVVDEVMPTGEHTVSFDAGSLPQGIYIYRKSAVSSQQSAVGKLVKY